MSTSEAATLEPRRIRGPSTLGSGVGRMWELTWLTAVSAFKRQYAESAFGYLWTIARPLMLFAILYVVFTRVLRFGGEVKDYPVLLLFNIVLFQLFAEATVASIRSFVGRGGLITQMDIPRLVLPLSAVVTVSFSFVASLLVVFCWILGYGIDPRWTWLLFPVILTPLVLLTVTVSMLLAVLYVRHRDVAQVWPVITRLFFYGSPVVYPIEVLPSGILHDVAAVNPMTPIFVQARVWIIDPTAPGWADVAEGALFVAPFVIFALICVTATVVFARLARRVAEDI